MQTAYFRGIVKTVAESQTIGQDQDAITARTKYVGNIDGTNMAVGFELVLSMMRHCIRIKN
jgi:hypothetical protein